jgi:hypothetical protein
LLTAEDSPAATVKPRLEAVGADLDRVYFANMIRDEIAEAFELPGDMRALDALVTDRQAKLVVIDPLVAHLGVGVNSWQDQSVRRALAPLHRLAETHDCAVVAVMHLNKGFDSDPLRRLGGSVGLTAAARSVLLLAADPEEPDGRDAPQRVLGHVKSNYGPLAPSLCLEVRSAVIPANGLEPDAETAFLAVCGESDHSGRDLLNVQDPGEMGAVADAEAFLQDQLGNGPRLRDELMPAATEAGLSWASVRRAKKKLGVESKKGRGGNGKWSWMLPDTEALGTEATGDEPDEHLEQVRLPSGPDQSSAGTHGEEAQLPLLSLFSDGRASP